MGQDDLLLKPSESFMDLAKDARVWSTAVGVVVESMVENYVFNMWRATFGFKTDGANGVPVFVDKAKKPLPAAMQNRQLFRVVTILVNLYLIKLASRFSGEAQYALLGSASTAAAHITQDLFPGLVSPVRK
jgi:hypothetical protein